MITELALLVSLISPATGPVSTEVGVKSSVPARTVASATASTAVSDCTEDCVWGTFQHNWVCVVGSAGHDCVEYSNGCGFIGCETTFLVDAGGALRQVALCDQKLNAARTHAIATGTLTQLDEALRSGLVTQKGSTRQAAVGTAVISQR
jgi:hypothetical protein